MVAERVVHAGFATLLFDLLDEQEADDRSAVFDIPFLAARLEDATLNVPALFDGWLPVGYFGASTGGGAALWAAADLGPRIGAVVSRGGRPDLAGSHLVNVKAPTLLIVGGRDDVVLQLNREAQERLRCVTELQVVPGATHLFEEPGALEQVADLAAGWFLAQMGPAT
jgi:putative phosphoribosyl transferase